MLQSAAFPCLGKAGLLGTIAFAWAAGSSSGLISMIENGTYTMMSATGWRRGPGLPGLVLKWGIPSMLQRKKGEQR